MTRSRRRGRPTSIVAGEDLHVLIHGFRRLLEQPETDWVLDDPVGHALMRAAARLEARLLIADATAYPGEPKLLADDETRLDRAILELYRRVVAAAKAEAKAEAKAQRRSA